VPKSARTVLATTRHRVGFRRFDFDAFRPFTRATSRSLWKRVTVAMSRSRMSTALLLHETIRFDFSMVRNSFSVRMTYPSGLPAGFRPAVHVPRLQPLAGCVMSSLSVASLPVERDQELLEPTPPESPRRPGHIEPALDVVFARCRSS
jgi:hypothetical protein